MEYSGPAAITDAEVDLAPSHDDSFKKNWPLFEPHNNRELAADPVSLHPRPLAPASHKRPMEHGSDTSSTPSSPVAKISERGEAPAQHSLSDYPLPRSLPQTAPSLPPPAAPAFAPRDDYIKLVFKENLSCDVKLRWLNEVTKALCLDRELAEMKMPAITSRFVYILRRRNDIIERVMDGEFLSMHLGNQDSIDRPRKFPTYLITLYPVGVDPSLAKNDLPGVHTVRRFLQNETPINRLVVTWSFLEPPPSVYYFSFLPCLPPCELRRMKDEQPWCFKCWGIGHISRYCSAYEKCVWCAADHATCSYPHRTHSTPTDAAASVSTLESPPTLAPDTLNGCALVMP